MDPAPPTAPAREPAAGSGASPFRRRQGPKPTARILVFFDPKGAFASVAQKPLAVLTLALMLGFALVPAVTYVARADLRAFVDHQIKASGKADAMTPEQREQAVTIGAKAMTGFFPGLALVARGAWILIAAALSFALLRGSKPELRFAPVVGAVALAMAPLAIHDVLATIAYLSKDVMSINGLNPVLSNPAAWLELDEKSSPLGALLKGLDLFDLWTCALIGIGINVVAGTRSSVPYVVAFGGHGFSVARALVAAFAVSHAAS
ncbi:MAG TPA: hypothetical protein VGO62_02790 [Myxococcota bacterium]|jgi:hypothetical protein